MNKSKVSKIENVDQAEDAMYQLYILVSYVEACEAQMQLAINKLMRQAKKVQKSSSDDIQPYMSEIDEIVKALVAYAKSPETLIGRGEAISLTLPQGSRITKRITQPKLLIPPRMAKRLIKLFERKNITEVLRYRAELNIKALREYINRRSSIPLPYIRDTKQEVYELLPAGLEKAVEFRKTRTLPRRKKQE